VLMIRNSSLSAPTSATKHIEKGFPGHRLEALGSELGTNLET
jgi:hypothetical protein